MDLSPNPTRPDAERVWFRFLRVEARIRVSVAGRLKSVGLSIPQCDVLTTLTEHEGVTQQELAAHLYVTKGNISGLIDRLAAAGLVERRPITGDRRSYSICLTEAGWRAAEAGIAIQRGFVAETFGRVPAEQLAGFEAFLVGVRDRLRQIDAETPSHLIADPAETA